MLQGFCLRLAFTFLGVALLAHSASAQAGARDLQTPADLSSEAAWIFSDASPATHPQTPATPGNQPLATQSGPLPGIASSLAFMPGVAVHGFGHFYAGRPLTGALLLAVEAGSVAMMARGGSDLWDTLGNGRAANLTNGNASTGQLSRGIGLAAGGVMLFLASWFYDISGAPLAVMEDEAKHKTENLQSPQVKPQLSQRGMELAIHWKF